MTSEKMRKEFEVQFVRHLEQEGWNKASHRIMFDRDCVGKYMAARTDGAWWAWQASRESLVIDLDAAAESLAEAMDYPWEFMPEQGRARMKASVLMIIEAAGLKVKP